MKRAQGLRREIAGFQEQEGIVAGTPLAYPAKMTRPCSPWDLGWDEANELPTMGLSSGLPEADAGTTPSIVGRHCCPAESRFAMVVVVVLSWRWLGLVLRAQ